MTSEKAEGGKAPSSGSDGNAHGSSLVYDFSSPVRGSFTIELEEDTSSFKYLVEMGERNASAVSAGHSTGFWNVRVPLKKLGGAFGASVCPHTNNELIPSGARKISLFIFMYQF